MTVDSALDTYGKNIPERFWKLRKPAASEAISISPEIWLQAATSQQQQLPLDLSTARYSSIESLYQDVLDESIFGPDRYRLSRLKRIYYSYARPVLPTSSRQLIRSLRQGSVEKESLIGWPIEDSFVEFHYGVLYTVISSLGTEKLEMIGLWPDEKRFGFVLTHDVEARAGHDYVRAIMDVEEKYGFRSSFNFVPEGYSIDDSLIKEIRSRGFEVGVHGLNHDGRLFFSEAEFMRRAAKINAYVARWNCSGYRSPMTHRNPAWMQALEIDYDLSFFDTDPYEPMAGGTMTIWPYFLGRFVELPYTLMQDHTYLEVFKYRSPDVWLRKVEFIRENRGMALLNAHPDYLIDPEHFQVYEAFLAAMAEYTDMWHALPKDVASWWRRRDSISVDEPQLSNHGGEDPRVTIWELARTESELLIHTDPARTTTTAASAL